MTIPVVTARWSAPSGRFGVLVHGGAGARSRDVHAAEETPGTVVAAAAAHRILLDGGTALDAVERAVTVLEDDPHYNAGLGAVLTEQGEVELDAAIMEGTTLRAGAVTGVRHLRNAVLVARAVLEDGRHVFYDGPGAEALASSKGMTRVENTSMITDQARWKLAEWKLRQARAEGGGTVGAVARDAAGRVAAATSTGGILGKRSGRIGDSPVLGAGTYADDGAGAASATGHGEGILRVVLCARATALLREGGAPDQVAADVLAMMQARVGSTGGLILVDAAGRLGLARTTEQMAWAAAWDGGSVYGF